MYKGAPQKLWHPPKSATGLCLHPTGPWMESSGLMHDLPQVQCHDREPGELQCPSHIHCWPAKLLPVLPSSSRDAQQKRSFGIMSCLQTDDLVLEMKGSHQGLPLEGAFWGRVLLPFCTSAVAGAACNRICSVSEEEQGLFHETCCKLRSSCRNLPPPSAASARYSPAGGFIPL